MAQTLNQVPPVTEVPGRRYAHIFDLPVKGEAQTRPVDHSPCAIGGAYGVGWYEHFKDADTGEIFRVFCSDGVNGGKGSHSDVDMMYSRKCYDAVVKRTHEEADGGAKEVLVSRNERVLMQSFMHSTWLESEKDKRDGQDSQMGLEGGLVGYSHGVPVICDMKIEDRLPPR